MPGAELAHDHDRDPTPARTPECPGTLKPDPNQEDKKRPKSHPPRGTPPRSRFLAKMAPGPPLSKAD